MIAFQELKQIEELRNIQDKHRAFLKRYEGRLFGKELEGKNLTTWKNSSYKDNKFSTDINMIGRLPNRTLIEFDGDPEEAKKYLDRTEGILKENEWGYIRSTHNGKSDYLWIEFDRDLKDTEVESFLSWICPAGAEIDLNFASSKRIFPVLYAVHRKHSHYREMPVKINYGNQIDFDSLNIKVTKIKKSVQEDGYTIYKKEETFDSIDSEVINLSDLGNTIKRYFPSVWFETKACASLFASMSLKSLNGCPSLTLVGSPSGEKTTVLSFFYNHSLSYMSDDFTPRSFVSHSAGVKRDQLEQIDLLPRIKNKVLLSPELAPLFEAQKEKLLDNFSILTRVLDGEGLNRDSGVHGHRGYSGDYKFGWLGATTPLRASVWNIMGKIGNRLFFLNMRDKNRTSEDYVKMFQEEPYDKKVKICRGAVKSFLDKHFEKYPPRSLEWDAEQDIFILQEIVKYAQLLAKLRGTLMLWKSDDHYQYNFPIIEEPPRAINSLYNLAKGHALINGRTFLRSEDLDIVRSVAFSSMPHDRFEFLKLLLKHEGRLTTNVIQKELGCSDETARKTMKTFEVLGVVTTKTLPVTSDDIGRPMYFVEIKPEFSKLLDETQVLNDLEKSIPEQKRGVFDQYSAQEFVKSQKNLQNNEHTQVLNDLEKVKPSEKNPVQTKFLRENEFEEALE